jgi:hypothetical protein
MTDEIAELANRYIDALGGDLSDLQRDSCRRAAELTTLAARVRRSALDGAGFDLTELARLEDMATAAVEALRLPAVRHGPKELQVRFVGNATAKLSDGVIEQLEHLLSVDDDTAQGMAAKYLAEIDRLQSALADSSAALEAARNEAADAKREIEHAANAAARTVERQKPLQRTPPSGVACGDIMPMPITRPDPWSVNW